MCGRGINLCRITLGKKLSTMLLYECQAYRKNNFLRNVYGFFLSSCQLLHRLELNSICTFVRPRDPRVQDAVGDEAVDAPEAPVRAHHVREHVALRGAEDQAGPEAGVVARPHLARRNATKAVPHRYMGEVERPPPAPRPR